MSIAALPIGEPAISEAAGALRGRLPPPTRLVVAKPDERKTPEAR